MSLVELTAELKHEALAEGFSAVGIAPAVTPTGLHRFHEWLESGYAGEMSYLRNRAAAYEHPKHVMEGTRSLLMMALDYRTHDPVSAAGGQGRVSCYAWGEADYHDVIHAKLKRLQAVAKSIFPGTQWRGVVDTAPLLEREFAQLAGLGWQGKHTLLINPQAGSYFFLAALLTDTELEYDQRFELDHCGECTACLDACPTGAFPQPYVLDATKCISYLTIEKRSFNEDASLAEIGDWLFGCDVCQAVCPWNRFAPIGGESGFSPRVTPGLQQPGLIDLSALFALDDEQFRAIFRRTPLWRPKRRGLLRNAAVVAVNNPSPGVVKALELGATDADELVSESCKWALSRLT